MPTINLVKKRFIEDNASVEVRTLAYELASQTFQEDDQRTNVKLDDNKLYYKDTHDFAIKHWPEFVWDAKLRLGEEITDADFVT